MFVLSLEVFLLMSANISATLSFVEYSFLNGRPKNATPSSSIGLSYSVMISTPSPRYIPSEYMVASWLPGRMIVLKVASSNSFLISTLRCAPFSLLSKRSPEMTSTSTFSLLEVSNMVRSAAQRSSPIF